VKRCSALLLLLVFSASAVAADGVDYLRDVKPILAQKCFACHGALKQQSGLRLDTAAMILKGGESGAVIVTGKPGESLLVQRVSATDAQTRMPPEGEGEQLDARQLATIRAWIEQGAVAPAEPLPVDPRNHWAYRTPTRPDVPSVKRSQWVRNPIDAFIAAGHEREGLVPAEPTEKNVLLRRVYLDLIGLPPTTEELRVFLADGSPGAYERVVDNLLARPEYGQRWGRHWMDVWRYSDWAGYKQEVRESQRHIWRWRDWIIESLNADKGYDRMVLEMLAGDELAPGDSEVLRATGFLVRNRHSSNRNIWLDSAVEHTSKAFLGLTINCARCHDHKYDPIPQTAYYRMRALFESHDVAIDRLPRQPDLLKDGLVRVFDGRPEEPTYLYVRGNEKQPDKEHPITPGLPEVLSGELEIQPVSLPQEAWYPGLRKEFQDEDLAAARKAASQALVALNKVRESAKEAHTETDDAKKPNVVVAEARYAVAQSELESLEARWVADFAKFATPRDVRFEELATAAAKIERQAALCRAELVVVQGEQAQAAATLALKPDDAKSKTALTKAEKDLATARENLEKARSALDKTDSSFTSVGKPYPPTSTGRRLALARWITRDDNPLTARVAVNHIWLRHFGAPLVENVFDFGMRSPRPAMADLLDWLSVELVETGWSMKHLHRLMVMSNAYRLASGGGELDAASQQRDPDNRYLWHMNTRRLEAELVRDCLLYVGGSLDLSFGGPDIDQQLGETSRRRSVYFRHAYEKQMQFLVLFDAANVNECYRRSESVIPQQALAVANSALSLGQSRLLAQRLSQADGRDPEGDRKFIHAVFEQILSRNPSTYELTMCEKFLANQTARLTAPEKLTVFTGATKAEVGPSPEPRLRSRENLVHVLLNHNDFVTIR
jgi:mono/diheme cytochrome c family protein